MFVASHWKCLSRRVSSCRFLLIPTTHLSYNFLYTSLVPSFSLGLCTRPFCTPVLGASSKKAKQGEKELVLSICSFPPSSPYPYLTFGVASLHILSLFTLFSHCLHPNPSLSFPLFSRKSSILSLSRWRFELCFLRQVRPYPP